MSLFATTIVTASFVLFGVIILAELIMKRDGKRFFIQALLALGAFFLINAFTGYPEPDRSLAFGAGINPLLAVGLMFVAIALGMGARYYFYMRAFSWNGLLKPLVITPIVMMPLLGSVIGATEIGDMQLVSYLFLAFQNGFFWRVVFEQAEKRLKEPVEETG